MPPSLSITELALQRSDSLHQQKISSNALDKGLAGSHLVKHDSIFSIPHPPTNENIKLVNHFSLHLHRV
jgi:hypothetical protein